MTAALGPARRALLHAVWELRGVRDVEALCRAVLAEAIRRRKPTPPLTASEFEDTLRHLLGQVVIEERRFLRRGLDAKPGIVFSGWLAQQLRGRVIDYWREAYGRSGQHRVPLGSPSVFDADTGVEDDDDAGAGWARRSRGAPAEPACGWAVPGGRIHPDGDRVHARLAGVEGGRDGDGAPPAGGGAGGGGLWVDCECGWRTYRQAPNGRPDWHFEMTCTACGAALEVTA